MAAPSVPLRRDHVIPRILIVGAAIVVVVTATLITLGILLRPSGPATVQVPLNPAVEARWGIRVTQVAVTADGGLVDFRFIVLDPDKASEMLSNVDNLPVLRPDGTNTLVNSAAQMADTHNLRAGQTYFLLYRNSGGAVRSARSVSVLFGDLRIDHVPVR